MKAAQLSVSQSIYVVFLYSLPAMIVLCFIVGNYYLRVNEVGLYISEYKELVDSAYALEQGQPAEESTPLTTRLQNQPEISGILNPQKQDAAGESAYTPTQQLVNHFISAIDAENSSHTRSGMIDGAVQQQIVKIWGNNALIICVMALTPFLLLGGRLGFTSKLSLSYQARKDAATSGVWMKLVVALIISYGWLYIINPNGRGASTVVQYLISVDLSKTDTLPMLLRDMKITPVIAAFLGWYLYLLTYFFSKMTTDDVVSAQAYGALLQKFLFAWGVTIVFLSTVDSGNVTIIAFLLGYFPMAAFSLIKDKGLNLLQGNGDKQDNGQLSELPGISRWQILRLEEEGIDCLAALAYGRRDNLNDQMPNMALLVNYWTDIARLYTIVGKEGYNSIKNACLTASEFVLRTNEPDFDAIAAKAGINNPQEIRRVLMATFPELACLPAQVNTQPMPAVEAG